MRLRTSLLALAVSLLALPAFPQGNPTGTISGQVVDSQSLALPGVTVTVESPNLQGKRSTTTSANGDYIFALLPPGEYTVSFELTGFQSVKRKAQVTPATAVPVSATLNVATVTEEITVTSTSSEPFQQTAPAATSFKAELIDRLPLDRSLNATVLLTPGVQGTGPQGGITISGSTSFENLFLINGVVINENIRGQSLPLFIEDAIQETTTTTASISAEFGRFSGGVVNAVTKSGGNEFSGSFRTTFDNDNWRALTPFPNDTKKDKVVPTYELTLGGPILRDRLWFFGASRVKNNETAQQTRITNLPFDQSDNEKRYEGKLTYSLSANHNLRLSYINVQRAQGNNFFDNVMDFRSLYDRETPQDLISANYTGTLASNFFVEAQFSQRRFTFKGSGSRFTDLIQGTLLLDQQRNNTRYWAPTFCGVCDDEKRDNKNYLVKANYFLSTSSAGSHNLVFGVDSYDDQRFSNNHQSGSDYRVYSTTAIVDGANLYPVFDGNTFIRWTPIFKGTEGTNFRTNSVFVNDTWRLNSHFTFNAGLRFDKNDGADSAGTKVVKDSNLSPRLAVTFDPNGSGQWTLNASYGKYVAAIANGIADGASSGGQPASVDFTYAGPLVNSGAGAPRVAPDQALRTLFDWFNANGGTNRPTRGAPSLPGVNTQIGASLKSPNVVEYSVGATRRLGNRGLVRVDGIYRKFQDFYSQRADLSTGKVNDSILSQFGLVPTGRLFDLRVTENTNKLERNYKGINTQINYRINERLDVGGNYTLSHAKGNFDGETGPNGPVSGNLDFYPEYKQQSWTAPVGDLAVDSRHKLRAWFNWNAPTPAWFGAATIGILQRFNSGAPYGANGSVDTRPFVTNPGYATPPANVTYFFTNRDAFRTADAWRTDIALNYSRRLNGIGKHTELFAKVEVWNVLNSDKLANFTDNDCSTGGCINTSVLTRVTNGSQFSAFNPFTQQPAQGTNWALGPDFGTALSRYAYQTPRTFRFAVGFRF
jgi:outer membrane receptor for ferrienterochelin and colicin